MERINRRYAIIYIDRTGESLAWENKFSPEMIHEYYTLDTSNLQWNYYVIIASEAVKEGEIGVGIEEDECYARKYVMPANEIDEFVAKMFPEITDRLATIELISGQSFKEVESKLNEVLAGREDVGVQKSLLRDYNESSTLYQIDILRAHLIRHPDITMLYGTHLKDEIFWVKKKLYPFIKQK